MSTQPFLHQQKGNGWAPWDCVEGAKPGLLDACSWFAAQALSESPLLVGERAPGLLGFSLSADLMSSGCPESQHQAEPPKAVVATFALGWCPRRCGHCGDYAVCLAGKATVLPRKLQARDPTGWWNTSSNTLRLSAAELGAATEKFAPLSFFHRGCVGHGGVCVGHGCCIGAQS